MRCSSHYWYCWQPSPLLCPELLPTPLEHVPVLRPAVHQLGHISSQGALLNTDTPSGSYPSISIILFLITLNECLRSWFLLRHPRPSSVSESLNLSPKVAFQLSFCVIFGVHLLPRSEARGAIPCCLAGKVYIIASHPWSLPNSSSWLSILDS